MENIGYTTSIHENVKHNWCYLTIGSIIRFNGRKCVVTHTHIPNGNRLYTREGKDTKDITPSTHGYLKEVISGKEFSANWSTIIKENILYYEKP